MSDDEIREALEMVMMCPASFYRRAVGEWAMTPEQREQSDREIFDQVGELIRNAAPLRSH